MKPCDIPTGRSTLEGAEAASPQAPKISLRRFVLSDLDALMEFLGDESVSRYTRWNPCRTKEEAAHFLKSIILPHPWCRAICLDGDDGNQQPVGFLYVIPFSGMEICKVELSAGLAQKQWGRGIMEAAVRVAVGEVFKTCPWVERIEAQVVSEHKAAQRVLEKSDFKLEAVLKRSAVIEGKIMDVLIYSILRPRSHM